MGHPTPPAITAVAAAAPAAMLPLIMIVLFVVVASQAQRLTTNAAALVGLVPIYAAFLVIMAALGTVTAKIAGLNVPAERSLTFSGATRTPCSAGPGRHAPSLAVLALVAGRIPHLDIPRPPDSRFR